MNLEKAIRALLKTWVYINQRLDKIVSTFLRSGCPVKITPWVQQTILIQSTQVNQLKISWKRRGFVFWNGHVSLYGCCGMRSTGLCSQDFPETHLQGEWSKIFLQRCAHLICSSRKNLVKVIAAEGGLLTTSSCIAEVYSTCSTKKYEQYNCMCVISLVRSCMCIIIVNNCELCTDTFYQ